MTIELKTIQFNLGGTTTSESSDVSMYFPKKVVTDFGGVLTDQTVVATNFATGDLSFTGTYQNPGDLLIIGNDTVFDQVGVQSSGGATGSTAVVEYWNGAWTTLSTRANAGNSSFINAGLQDLNWIIPSDWATTTINGYTGYFIRFRKTVAGSSNGACSVITIRNNSTAALKFFAFDKAWTAASSDTVWTDVTSGMADYTGDFNLTGASGDNLYLGSNEIFNIFTLVTGSTAPAGGTRIYEYWNGSSWVTLTTTRFAGSNNNLTTTTATFSFTFDVPSDWTPVAVNEVPTRYWIRLRVGTLYSTAGNLNYGVCGRRFALPTKTIFIPETVSRSFKSAYIKFNFKLNNVGSDIAYVRCDLQAGANPITNVTGGHIPSAVNSGEQTGLANCFDVTSFFNAYFLAGTSISLDTFFSIVANRPYGNHAFFNAELFLTYEADSGTTRIKTVNIPINSLMWKNQQQSALNGVVWNDWTDLDVIPNLDTYLPENSKVYRDRYLVLQGNEGANNSSNYYLMTRVDGIIYKTELIGEGANNGMTLFQNTDLVNVPTNAEQRIQILAGDTRATTPGHMWNGIHGFVVVTYEYNHTNSSSIMNSIELPFLFDSPTAQSLSGQTADTKPTNRTLDLVINETNPVLQKCTFEAGFSSNDSSTAQHPSCGIDINSDGFDQFFDWVFINRGGSWADLTSDAKNIVNTPNLAYASSGLGGQTGDILYLGDAKKFFRLSMEISGTTNQLKTWEYWNGAWTPLHDTFNKVFIYDDSAALFIDETADSASETSSDVTFTGVFSSTNDILYLGDDVKFQNIFMHHSTSRSGGTIQWEYWNGSTWADATLLMRSANTNMLNLIPTQNECYLRFNNPPDWALTTVNGHNKYWLRARALTGAGTAGVASMITRPDKILSYSYTLFCGTALTGQFDLDMPNDWTTTTVNGQTGFFIRIRAVNNSSGTYTYNAINKMTLFEFTRSTMSGLTQFKFRERFGSNPLIKGHNSLFMQFCNRRSVSGANYQPYGRVILNYTSDKTIDAAYHNKTIRDLIRINYLPTNKDPFTAFVPSLGTKWFVSNFGHEIIAAHQSVGQAVGDFYACPLPSEGLKSHLNIGKFGFVHLSEEDTRQQFTDDYQVSFKRHPLDSNRLDFTVSRPWFVSTVIATNFKYAWIVMPTFHNLNKVVTVSVLGYSGNGSGITVNVYNANNEKVLSITTGVGGTATFDWYFDNEVMYAEAIQGNQYGRSATAAITSGVMKIQFKKPFGIVA